MIDKSLKIKLFIVGVIFVISLANYKSLLFLEPQIYSTYPLSLIVISAISLGMIFSVMIYNLAIYVHSKEKEHLFYALTQLFVLLFLITLESLYISPFDELYHIKSLRLHSLTRVGLLITSVLFIREFLQTYKIKKLDLTVKIVLSLAYIDLFIALVSRQNIITTLIPISLFIWIIISQATSLIKNKNLSFWLFYIGWNLVVVISISVYTGVSNIINSNFPFLHIAFAIESILLSLALTYKIKLLINEKNQQQSILLQQSRLASMGEMIASIAHQWRQPLTHLSYLFMNIKKNSQDHNVVEKKLKEANEQLTYMSKTIDDFRNFYKPTKEKERFDIKTSIENTLNIANIKAEIKVIKNFQHNSNKNEFEQAILNILKNSIDAKADATIHITIDDPKITIKDNAGGIDKKDLDKIFIPYFTTKEDSDGIGLYISKMIVEGKMGGKLEVKTVKDETIFTIYLR